MKDFAEIYEEYVKQIYVLLWKLCRNELLAEELTQQTFYKAFLHINKFEQRCKLSTWLCAIARNEWLLECRKNKKLITLDGLEETSCSRDMEDELVKKEQLQIMRKAILSLSDPYQNVLLLHIYGELPLREIGLLFNKSESWAKVTFLRAKQKIRLEMEEGI